MFKPYLDDYYKSKINVKEMCKKVGSSPTSFQRWLKKNGFLPRQEYLKHIDTGIEELNRVLKNRYSSIINRCNGGSTDQYGHYAGMDYIAVYEWVIFCNAQREHLQVLWQSYILHYKNSRYAVSIDRINEKEGYVIRNMQFVTHGFNSWKRILNPVSVTHDGEVDYFMSCEEASYFYGLRRQAIGECLNRTEFHIKGYIVKPIDVEAVLSKHKLSTLVEYYDMLLSRDNKGWDTRKRWKNNHR